MLPSQQWQFKMEIPTTLKENSCVRPYLGRYLLYTFKMLIIMTWAPEVAFWDATPGNNTPARVVGSLNENCRWISQSDSFHQGTSSKQLSNISMTLFLRQIIILTVVTTHRNEPYRIANFVFQKGTYREMCCYFEKQIDFLPVVIECEFQGKNCISDIETDKCYD